MSTQPLTPVAVAADSSPFTTLPAEQPVRPASVGSSHSSTSSNEVVVVDSVKEEEGEHLGTVTQEKLEDTPKQDEPQPNVDEPQPDVDELQPDVDELQPDVDEPQPDVDEPQPDVNQTKPDEVLVVVTENSSALTTMVPTPEVIAIPEKSTAAQVAEAAGHATGKIASRFPGCLAKTSAFVTRLNKYINSDHRLRSSLC